jgi:thiamine-phosphate pyrophosphorylase
VKRTSSWDEVLLYLVAPAHLAAGPLDGFVEDLVAAGVGAIQLREKEMEAADILRVARPILERCNEAGVPFVINDRPDIAAALGADAVHLGTNDLPTRFARAVFDGAVGRSTHSRSDITVALTEQDPDYIAVGPVHETPTKPGRPAAGIDLIRLAAETVDIPWFAIGGIEESNLDTVLEAGARRIVVVRAVTEAGDPPAAAARLHSRLARIP